MKYLTTVYLFLLLVCSNVAHGTPTGYGLTSPSTDSDGNFTISWSFSDEDEESDHYCVFFRIEIEKDGSLYEFEETADCDQLSYDAINFTDGIYDITLKTWLYDEGGAYFTGITSTQTTVNGSGTQTSTTYELNFENGFQGWGNGWSNTTGENWTPRSGSTPSNYTGPSSASKGSYYAYMETSTGFANYSGDTATLTSPSFEVEGGVLNFDYHMYGSQIGTLKVELYNGGTWHTLWEKSGQQHSSSGASWSTAKISLLNYSGASTIRIVGIAAAGYMGDMAIDNVIYDSEGVTGFTDDYQVFKSSVNGTSIALTTENWPSVGDIQLVWNGSSYSISTVTSTSGWQSAAIDLIFSDVNLDGAIDILMKNVDVAIPAINGVFDQILYANQGGSTAISITAIDEEFQSFFGDLFGWILDNEYFENQASTTKQVNTSSATWSGFASSYVGALFVKGLCDASPSSGSFCEISFQNPSNCNQFVTVYDENGNPNGSGYYDVCESTYQIWKYSVGSQTVEIFDFSVLNQDAIEAADAIKDVFVDGESGVNDSNVEAAEDIFTNVLGSTFELPLPSTSLPTIVITDFPIPDTGTDTDIKPALKWLGRLFQVFNVISMAEVIEGIVDENRPVMHYTTTIGKLGIDSSQIIESSSGQVFFTHIAYPSSDIAMDKLGLCGDTRVGYYVMSHANIIGLSPFTPVAPLSCLDDISTRSGGGPEATASSPIPLIEARFIPIAQNLGL